MKKELVLVGGGHAHMMVLENISRFVEKGVNVTVIGPSFYHYYSGMGPGMLGGTYSPEDIRFSTRKVVEHQGGTFVKGRVVKIDPVEKKVFCRSGDSFDYDLLSFNAGSYVSLELLKDGSEKPACKSSACETPDNVYPVKPIEKLREAADKLKVLFRQRTVHVSGVGGGPSSAEIAGNVWQLAKQTQGYQPQIHIFAGKEFMTKFPESVRLRMVKALADKEIRIDETGYVRAVEPDRIILESGQQISTDFIFMASGVRPSTIFQASGLPVGSDNGLLVNSYLQSVQYPEIFGGGDCICFEDRPLDKVGVYAVRQNPVLLHNLLASVDGSTLKPFDPGPDYLLIFNAGGGTGVLKKQWLVFRGKPAFWIKDYIDRKFMNKFQAFEKSV